MNRLTSLARVIPTYLAAGALAGVAIGGAEAIVLNLSDPFLNDRAILWWAPLFYASLFAPLGAACGIVCHISLALRGYQRVPELAYRITFGAMLLAGTVTALRWRLHADHAWLAAEYGRRLVDVGILTTAMTLALLGFRVTRKILLPRQSVIAGVFVIVCAIASYIPVENSRGLAPSRASPARGPNVILIAIDTLRADYLKLYDPNAATETPAIERLARDAILFRNSLAQGTWTKASFGVIFTSQHPREHTAIDTTRKLPYDVVTLAETLHDDGYTTLGMSNCNPNNSIEMQFEQGFGYFEDLRPRGFLFGVPVSGRRLILYKRFVGPKIERLLPYSVNVEQYYQRANRVAATGLEWIDAATDRERPFFLVLHFMDPHDPYMGGQSKGTGYTHHLMRSIPREPLVEEFMNAYTGDINFMDVHIGAFLDGLRERGLYDDALILLTSDHGEEFLEHGGFSHGQSVYEELVRIPLVVKLPENRAAGAQNESLARHIDIAPTILSLANIDIPASMQGEALIAADGQFLNENIQYAFSEANLFGLNLVSVRTDTEKFIRDSSYGGEITLRELYDLARDPAETMNLANSGGNEADALTSIIAEFLTGHSDPPASENSELSPATVERLRALGYVE